MHGKRMFLAALAALLAALSPLASAQNPPAPQAPPRLPQMVRPLRQAAPPKTEAVAANAAEAAADEPAAASPAPESGDKMLSLKFSDTPLEMVLDRYSELTGRTILMAPGVKVNITLRIEKRVTVPQAIAAIEAVLAMNNIALVNEGEMFVKVVPINTARQEAQPLRTSQDEALKDGNYLISEIIPLKHIEVTDAQAAIATVVHPYANIQALIRINSLLVTDTQSNLERVKQLLALIDQPVEMKEELHIIQVAHAKASDIKARLAEIIAETEAQQQKATPAVVRPSFTGPPGVIRATGASATPTRTVTTTEGEPKRDLIQGHVKLVADDRANILIIITRPENMEFFTKIVEAIDIGVEPDVIVKVFRLEYADATEVEGMLSKLIGASKDAASATPGAVPAAAKAMGSDAASTERSSELSEYVRQMQAQRAAAAAGAGAAAPVKSSVGELSASNVKILSDKRSNAVIIMASKGDMAAIEDVIKDMDIMLSQVLIEAIIIGVTLDKTSETGVDWLQRSMTAFEQKDNGTKKPLFAFTGGTGLGAGTPINALNTPGAFPGSLTYYMTFFDFNVDAVIKLTASDSRVRVISSPVILTTDNKKAEIDISSDFYFYKGQKPVTSVDGGVQYVEDVDRIAVGTTLSVTPRINKNKFVVMEIEQKTEDADQKQAIPNQGVWPVLSRRKMSASIAVTSGDTIMLGGLTKKTENNTVVKIPFLGDIPILGIPFRDTTRQNKREEVVVFITPYVLDTPEDIRSDALRRRNAIDAVGLWQRGWSNSKLADPSDEEARLAKIKQKLEQKKPAAPAAPAPAKSAPAPAKSATLPAPSTPPPG